MTTPATPPSPTPAGDDRNLVAVDATTAVSFEDKLRVFWTKNRNVVTGVCVGIALAIVAKGGWDYLGRQKETSVGKAYADATTPEQLKSFAASHPDHELGGVARIRLADDAYKAGKFADAVTGYDQAIAALKEGPLVARARIGRALARLQSGQAAEASKALKELAEDAQQFKAVRAEAAYHLTSLAVEAKNADEAQKLVDQLMQLDASSPWTQRAMSLRASLPATPAPAAAAAAKKDEPPSGVQVKLPGK
jgi:hypothetical protein